jgi:hypothetical protein
MGSEPTPEIAEDLAACPDQLTEEQAFRELGLLYNYADDDSRQFTRWQMLTAIQHGWTLEKATAHTTGWIVTDANGTRYRTWEAGFSAWTEAREDATRYARRTDAEAVHAEDEDAWRVVPYSDAPTPPKVAGDAEEVSLAECPPGLFWAGDTLGMKSEYADNSGRIDAFIVESGEFLWGPAPQTIARQRAMRVRPIPNAAALIRTQAAELATMREDRKGPPYASDDWQAKGYTSAAEEIEDMANVGRTLMEALPEGYSYMDSPAEIVSDLQNDVEEAEAARLTAERDLAAAVEVLRPFVDLGPQRGAWGVISKKLDGMAPLTVTVTKAQMLAACTFLATKDNGHE